jgi:hypothetical protein
MTGVYSGLMSRLKAFHMVAILPICLFACAKSIVPLVSKAPVDPTMVANQGRDEQVMDAVLTHFLADHAKDAWTLGRRSGRVLLHLRNPDKMGILDQTAGDIGKRKLAPGLLDALLKRNRGKGWDSIPFSFQKFQLDPRVEIKDMELNRPLKPSGRLGQFEMYEEYKGVFRAFAPGYSKDGQKAVVRAWVGPSAHGATVTYALELKNGKWTVLWREFSFYV